jgi:hypothetical protein
LKSRSIWRRDSPVAAAISSSDSGLLDVLLHQLRDLDQALVR